MKRSRGLNLVNLYYSVPAQKGNRSKLVNELLTTVLTKEETNDKTEINTRS